MYLKLGSRLTFLTTFVIDSFIDIFVYILIDILIGIFNENPYAFLHFWTRDLGIPGFSGFLDFAVCGGVLC